MSIGTWTGQIKINLKEEFSEKISEHSDIFEERSPTQEMYNRIDNIIENAPTPEEKAERHRDKAEEHRQKAEKWEEKVEVKQAKQNLREARKELRQVKDTISEIGDGGVKQREEIEEEILEKYRHREKFEGYSDDQIKEEVSFERMVKRKLDKQPDLEELEAKREKLKEKISELEDQLN